MRSVLGFLLSRWFWSAVGVLGLSLFIWYLSPLVSFADYYHPFDSSVVRAALIALLVLAFIGAWLWKRSKAKNAEAQLAQGILAAQNPFLGAPAKAGAAESEQVAVLRKRFEEALALLKQTARKKGGALRVLGGNYLYELPWYLLIGPPGSGKSTALLNSGLQFPLAERFGHEEISGVGGTRSCDWWFADRAVLLDTAGRYATQESDRAADSGEWQGFLKLLAKFRPRRPINGVILTISAADLLQESASEQEKHARALRTRVQELHEQLRVRFPIYVMISKMDLLPGFMEFFGDLGREDRAQVWGTTFDPRRQVQTLEDLPLRLGALEARINQRLIDRLQSERDLQQRALLYAFPQHLHVLGDTLAEFLKKVFAPSRFEEEPMIRGVYFTSGTQEGSPIDRIMGSVARALRLEHKVLPPHRSSGKSFFITRLFNDVIFAEIGIAGTNVRWERRRALLQWAAYAVAGVVTFGLILAWTLSYQQNKAYIHEVEAKLKAISEQVSALGLDQSSDLVELLPVLRSVRDLSSTTGNPESEPPWSLRFGLNQGEKLAAASDAAYRRMLQDVFLPRIAFRIEDQLRSGGRQNLELLYEGLKAYIMLTEPKHFDPKALKAFVTAEWEANLPREVTREQRAELEVHLDRLLALGGVTFPVEPDKQLIASTRDTIASIPTVQRIYNRLKLQEARGIAEFTAAKAGGPSAPLVFERASGQPLTRGVPGFFSYEGYHKVFTKASALVGLQLAQEETWVLDQPGDSRRISDVQAKAQVIADVRRLYLEDYRRTWDTFVKDIKLIQPRDLQQAVSQTRILSGADSPLPLLIRAVVKEVTLGEAGEKSAVETAVDSSKKKLVSIFGTPGGKAAVSSQDGPESIVDDHFAPLRRMVRGQPAPIDATMALMNDMLTYLVAAQAAVNSGAPPPPSDLPNKAKAEAPRMPEPLQSALSSLSQNATRILVEKTRVNLSQSLASVAEFCRKAVEGRYPFVRDASKDVTREDFARLFGPGGLLDDFFQKNLAAYVDTGSRPWKFRPTGDASIGQASASLIQFQRAQTIRDVFFKGGTAASIKLELKPVSLDASVTQFTIDIDGQVIKYSHGPQLQTAIQWPGPKGTSYVRIQVAPAANPAGQVFEGLWALFRLFDRAQVRPTDQPEKMLATFNVDGRSAQFEIVSGSVQNPLILRELQEFRCPGRL